MSLLSFLLTEIQDLYYLNREDGKTLDKGLAWCDSRERPTEPKTHIPPSESSESTQQGACELFSSKVCGLVR